MTTGDVAIDPRFCLECGWRPPDLTLPHRACWDHRIDVDLARRVTDALLEHRIPDNIRSFEALVPSSDSEVADEWYRLVARTDSWTVLPIAVQVLAQCGRDADVPLLHALSRGDTEALPFALPDPRFPSEPIVLQEVARAGLVMSAAGREILWPELEQLVDPLRGALLGVSALVGDGRSADPVTALVAEWPMDWEPVSFPESLCLVAGRHDALAMLVDAFCERMAHEEVGPGWFSNDLVLRRYRLEQLAGETAWRGEVLPSLLGVRRDAVERLQLGYTPDAPSEPASYVARQDLPAVTRHRIVLSELAEGTDPADWDGSARPRLGGQPAWLSEPTWPLSDAGAPYLFLGQLPVVDEPGRMLYLFITGPDHDTEAQPIVAVMQPGAPPRMPHAPMMTGPRDYTGVAADMTNPARPLLDRLGPVTWIPVRRNVTLVEELEPDWEQVGYENDYDYLPGDLSKVGGVRRDFDRDPEPPGEWRFLAQLQLDFWSVAVYGRPDGIAWTDCRW